MLLPICTCKGKLYYCMYSLAWKQHSSDEIKLKKPGGGGGGEIFLSHPFHTFDSSMQNNQHACKL